MNRKHPMRPRKSLLPFVAASLLAMTAATAQVAGSATGATGIDASGNYQSEVQACRSGRTQQDIDTCLREARNAQAERNKGALRQPSDDFQANAMARCEPLAGEEKAACKARVMGYGDVSGSVAGGGVLRQVETVVMPPGATEIKVEAPKTQEPVVLVPMPAQVRPRSPLPQQ